MKKKYLIGGIVVATALVSTAATAVLMPKTATSEPEPPYITDVNSRLDNHEARIGNAESNISSLQEKTGTAPTGNAPVPAATKSVPVSSGTVAGTTTAAPVPTPAAAQPVPGAPTTNGVDPDIGPTLHFSGSTPGSLNNGAPQL